MIVPTIQSIHATLVRTVVNYNVSGVNNTLYGFDSLNIKMRF